MNDRTAETLRELTRRVPPRSTVTTPVGNMGGSNRIDGQDAPGFAETIGLSFKRDNLPTRLITQDYGPHTPDPTFNVMEYVEPIVGERNKKHFIGVSSKTQADAIIGRVQGDEAIDERLSEAGFGSSMVGGVLAGVTSPESFIPGGAIYKGVKLGKGVAKSAVSTTVAGTVAGGVNEAGLKATSPTRTKEEMLTNTLLSGGLSGILGGVAGGVAVRKAVQQTDQLIAMRDVHRGISEAERQSVGAAATEDAKFTAGREDDADIAPTVLGEKASKAFQFVEKASPQGRAATGTSKVLQGIGNALAAPTAHTKGQMRGVGGEAGGEVLQRIRQSEDMTNVRFKKGRDEQFMKYLGVDKKQFGGTMLAGVTRPKDKLSLAEFNEEMYHTIVSGRPHSDIPEVTAAVQIWRKEVFNPLFERAQKVGIFSDEFVEEMENAKARGEDTAPYVSRIWDKNVISQRRATFEEFNRIYLREEEDKDIARYKQMVSENAELRASLKDAETTVEIDPELKAEFDKLHRRLSDLVDKEGNIVGRSDEDLNKVARTLGERIIGSTGFKMAYDDAEVKPTSENGAPGLGSPLRRRVYSIPDSYRATLSNGETVSVSDFVVRDPDYITRAYARKVSTSVEFMDRFGSVDMKQQLDDLVAEMDERMGAANTDAERKKIADEYNGTSVTPGHFKTMQQLRDIIQGTYGTPDSVDGVLYRGINAAKKYNMVTLMGGMVVSALPDAARVVMIDGMEGAFSLSKSLDKSVSVIKQMEADDLSDFGIVAEQELSIRSNAQSLYDDLEQPLTRGERALDTLANHMGSVTLMDRWNQMWKVIAARVAMRQMNRVMEKLSNGSTLDDLTEAERLSFGRSNFNHNWKKFRDQIAKHGQASGDVQAANLSAWDDPELARAYAVGIKTIVDDTIITPTGVDRPAMSHQPLGQLAFQFQSFGYASQSRTLHAGLQRRDGSFVVSAALMTMMGSMVYIAKAWTAQQTGSRKKEIDFSVNNLIAQGIDRGGAGGLLINGHNAVEKLTKGHVGLSHALALLAGDKDWEQMSRHASRSEASAVLGPTASLYENIGQVIQDTLTGSWNGQTERAAKRLVPYANVPWVMLPFSQIEQAIRD